ncbi:MAG TPA: outer membrane beta-barrel protein, partial [Rhodanobacter sp.]|nr:outer membrane beta-barrel protein [Rhodanobacter sp.]
MEAPIAEAAASQHGCRGVQRIVMMPHVAALLSHQLRKARPGACAVLAGAVLLACPQPARAQYIERYFQPGVPGYGSEAGVTVLSRQRPLYQEHGVQVGSFNIRPNLDEALSYNSNVDGVSNSPGSWIVATAPSITVGSTWSRNALGGGVTLHDYRYLDTPRQNHTDWTASLRGAYTIGSGDLTANYSHLALHQIATELGALPS